MRYPELSEFMNRRQMEISAERRRVVKQVELARDSNVTTKTMSRLFAGDNLPEPKSWTGLYRVFGPGFYAAIGHPELEPEDIDPRLQLLIDNQGNPGIDALLDQIEKNKDAILKADKPVRLVTFAT